MTAISTFRDAALFASAFAWFLPSCAPADDTRFNAPPGCLVDVPCKDDPQKTCQEPCDANTPPTQNNGGYGGSGGNTSSGGGGDAPVPVDVTGSVVAFTSATFDDFAPYVDPITIVAKDFDGKVVEANATNGDFDLSNLPSGNQWFLANDTTGAVGGAFSTYSHQRVEKGTALAVPVVPVNVLDGIADQITPNGLTTSRAHLVISVSDKGGASLEGVTVLALQGAVVGYDVAPGQFITGDVGTGTLGLAVVLNAVVPAPGTVTLALTYFGDPYQASVPIAPDTVTYALIGLDTGP